MNEQVFLEKMKDLMDNEDISKESVLTDLEEWDSVSILGFVSIALDFGKKVAMEQIRNCATIGDLYALLQQ